MQVVWFIPLLAMVCCAPAPLQEEALIQVQGDEQKSELVKRAMETIMYGNQQNGPKVIKRDPSYVDLSDAGGSVHAFPAHNTPAESEAMSDEEAEAMEPAGAEEEIAEALEGIGDQEVQSEDAQSDQTSVENDGNELSEQLQEVIPDKSEESDEENAIPAEISDEQDHSIVPDVNEISGLDQENEIPTELQLPNNDYGQGQWYDDVFDFVKTRPMYPPAYYDYYGTRKRRSSVPGFPSSMDMKRGHRTKRDLIYPGEEPYFDPAYFPETDLSDEYDSNEFEPYAEDNDEDRYLRYLELMAENQEPKYAELEDYDDMETEPQYEGVKMVTYEGEPGYFVPAKRQDLLSFVPGNKRSNYFYPSSPEPETHFRAFVPSKRNAEDYTQAYGRLIRLAQQLALQKDQTPGRGIGYEEYQWE